MLKKGKINIWLLILFFIIIIWFFTSESSKPESYLLLNVDYDKIDIIDADHKILEDKQTNISTIQKYTSTEPLSLPEVEILKENIVASDSEKLSSPVAFENSNYESTIIRATTTKGNRWKNSNELFSSKDETTMPSIPSNVRKNDSANEKENVLPINSPTNPSKDKEVRFAKSYNLHFN